MPRTPDRKKKKRKPSGKGPIPPAGMVLARILLGILLLAILYKGTHFMRSKPHPAPSALLPPLAAEGPSPAYRSQDFHFVVDGVPTLRGFSGTAAGPRRDLNALGEPMRVKGKTYPSGIGAQAPSEIVFGLDGKVRHFSCLAGVDEKGAGPASLKFVVKADGHVVFTSPLMRSDSAPVPIDLGVGGVRELALILDPVDIPEGDLGDWLSIQFKKGAP